jgi:phospholipid/cholesterol/gamma-HCH transport system substrate-binding protein
MERLSTLSDQLSNLLNEKNQKSLGHILENTDRLTGSLAASGPDMRATIAQTRATMKQASEAVDSIAALAKSTNALVTEDGRPMIADLRATVKKAQSSMTALDAAIAEAKPGLHTLSTETMPEVSQLVRDLRVMSESLGSVATKIDQGGAGALLGQPALPDYKPGRSGQ